MEKYQIKKITTEEIDDFYILLNDYPYVTNWQLLIEKNQENIFLLKSGEVIAGFFGLIFISEEYFSDMFFKQISNLDSQYFFIEQHMVPVDYKKLHSLFDSVCFSNIVIFTHLISKKKKFILSNLADEKYKGIFKEIENNKVYKDEVFFKIEKNIFLSIFN